MNKEEITNILLKEATDYKISCPRARKLAKEFGITSEEIGKICNRLKIKIYACELGCFK